MRRRSGGSMWCGVPDDLAVEADLAGCQPFEAGDAAQHRGLAAAGRPETRQPMWPFSSCSELADHEVAAEGEVDAGKVEGTSRSSRAYGVGNYCTPVFQMRSIIIRSVRGADFRRRGRNHGNGMDSTAGRARCAFGFLR